MMSIELTIVYIFLIISDVFQDQRHVIILLKCLIIKGNIYIIGYLNEIRYFMAFLK